MTTRYDDKVIWSEGMFIRAQHFQQESRYGEAQARHLFRSLRGYGWGFSRLRLNHDLLSIGQFAIEQASGVFPDGTPFALSAADNTLPPLQLDVGVHDQTIYLTLPAQQPGALEAADAGAEHLTRYIARDVDIVDSSAIDSSAAPIGVGRLRLRYALQDNDRGGWLSLGAARISEVRSDNTVVLDDNYIPPALDSRVSAVVSGLLTEVVGLLGHRGQAIAERLTAGSEGTSGELHDTLMLQTINRWQPLFRHLSSAAGIHAETAYANLVCLASELATFTRTDHQPPAFPSYDHDDLQTSFGPVMTALRQSLTAVLDRGALTIPLTKQRYNIRVAETPDRTIFSNYTFILVARADIPTETLRNGLLGQTKVGPVEQIRELVNAALPGIRLQPLATAPRQIPYHTGKAYFELDRSSPVWQQIANSSALAIHVAGDFPGIELELWAVKD